MCQFHPKFCLHQFVKYVTSSTSRSPPSVPTTSAIWRIMSSKTARCHLPTFPGADLTRSRALPHSVELRLTLVSHGCLGVPAPHRISPRRRNRNRPSNYRSRTRAVGSNSLLICYHYLIILNILVRTCLYSYSPSVAPNIFLLMVRSGIVFVTHPPKTFGRGRHTLSRHICYRSFGHCKPLRCGLPFPSLYFVIEESLKLAHLSLASTDIRDSRWSIR